MFYSRQVQYVKKITCGLTMYLGAFNPVYSGYFEASTGCFLKTLPVSEGTLKLLDNVG